MKLFTLFGIKFDHIDLRNALIFVFLEALIVLPCMGACMQAQDKITIPITDEDVMKMIEPEELEMRVLPIPETKTVPETRKQEAPKPKKKEHRVYPISNRIIKALCLQESGNNPNVLPGDDGKALGILQIHWNYVKDVNRIFGTNYTHEDMTDPEKAIDCTRKYLGHYALHAQAKGVTITNEVICRMHNGGLYGYKYKSTDKYWKEVQRFL